MTTQWHPSLLNRFIAPGIADFSTCEIPDLQGVHPEAQYWLANHFLNNVLGGHFKGKTRQFAVNLVFRAQIGFSLYHQARQSTQQFLAESSRHNPKSGLYFKTLALWESCFLNNQIFLDVFTKMTGNRAFEPGDGCRYQRAYDIANTIKHWGNDIHGGRHHEDDTVPMWLSNDGFHTRMHQLTYVELGDLINEAATLADDLQDPTSLAAQKNA